MISPLPKNRPTTAPAPITAARTSAKQPPTGTAATRPATSDALLPKPQRPVKFNPWLLSLALVVFSGARTEVAAQYQPVARPPVAPPDARTFEERGRAYGIQLEPPDPERLFRLESEASLRERLRQEARQRDERVDFPKDIALVLPGERYLGRAWPLMSTEVVPNVVCYNPLYFEDLNTERHAWSLCLAQPLVSTVKFYADLAYLPYQFGLKHPCETVCSAGYILPGEPTPYRCYIPPLTAKAAAFQLAVLLGGIAIFP